MATKKRIKPSLGPTQEQLRQFEISNNLPQPRLPQAFLGAPRGTASTSKSPTNIVPKVDGNVGVENFGTSATSPLIGSTGGAPEAASPIPGIEEPVRPTPQEPGKAGFKEFGIDVLNLLPGVDLKGGALSAGATPQGPQDIQTDPGRAQRALAPTTTPTLPGSFVLGADRPGEPTDIPEGGAPEEGGPTAEQLRDTILGDDLNQKILFGSQVEPIPTFTTGTLTENGLEGFPIFNDAGQVIGTEPVDPQERLEAAQFLERRNLRSILQAASLQQVADVTELASQQAESEAFAITLSPQSQAQMDSGELSTNLAASSKQMSEIMFMDAGPEQTQAAFEFAAEPLFEVALGMRWDTDEQAFIAREGISAESMDPRVAAYHARIKGWYAQRDQVLQLVEESTRNKSALELHSSQLENIRRDTNLAWTEGNLTRLEELEFERAEVELQILKDTSRRETLRELRALATGGPNAMMMARMFGLLDIYEQDLGMKLTFGKNLNLPPGGALPGPAQLGSMGEFERVGSMIAWMEATGGTVDDFVTAFQAQLPRAAVQATSVSVI